MSDGKKRLFGNALRKAERLEKLAKLSSKRGTNDSSVANLSIISENASELSHEIHNFEESNTVAANLQSTNQLNSIVTGKSSEGSPFFGFSPQNPPNNKVLLETDTVSEEFLGFSPLRSSTPKISLAKSAEMPNNDFATHSPSITGKLSPIKSIDRFEDNPRPSSEVSPRLEFTSQTFSNCTSIDFRRLSSNSKSSNSSTSFESDLTSTLPFFAKIRVFARCEYDYLESLHECCCMSMVALLYSVHKIIYDWDASDLEAILDLGHEYFNESLTCRQQFLEIEMGSFFKPSELIQSLNIFNKCYDIDVGNFNFNGLLDEENLLLGFAYLDEILCSLAILEINNLSYGLVICRFSTEKVEYALFDCHGRTWDGKRFGEYCSILFFTNVNSVVSLLCTEFCDFDAFQFYAVNFRFAFNTLDGSAKEILIPPEDITNRETTITETLPSPVPFPLPPAEDFPLLRGEFFYKKIFGTFDQFSASFPQPHHQCTAMSAAALAYNVIKSASNWDSHDLDSVLLAGQQYYTFNLNHMSLEYPNVGTPNSYLEALALTPYLEIGELSFTVTPSLDDYVGGFHDDRQILSNAIAAIERKKLVSVVITYRTYSYGLIRCARDNNTSSYVFFDSHGRNFNGHRPGTSSAILFFNNADDFISFFLTEFPLLREVDEADEGALNRMIILVPLSITCNSVARVNSPTQQHSTDDISQIIRDFDAANDAFNDIESQISVPLLPEVRTEEKYQFIPYHLYADEPFYDIEQSVDIERDIKPESHLCVAASIVAAVFDTHIKVVDKWIESDLDEIFEVAIAFYKHSCDVLIKNGVNSLPVDIFDLDTEFGFDDDAFVMIPETNRIEIKHLHELYRVLQRFSSSYYRYGILTICDDTYAVIKLSNCTRGRIALYDIHGRKDDAGRIGKDNDLFSTVLYFVHMWQLIRFLLEENEIEFPFTFYPIKVEKIAKLVTPVAADQTHLFHAIISGRLAQNDSCFSVATRNNQCAGNSLVFLAYTSLIKDNWNRTDIDRILYIGDNVYEISYASAIKRLPRNNRYISAAEVLRKIVISTDGMRTSEISVFCEPVSELSGAFGKFAYTYIERFFSKQIYGVFISSSKAVALYRFNNTYVLFDPHARNSDGFYDNAGTANIFLFQSIRNLYRFLLREGYAAEREFTLTGFTFRTNRKTKTVPEIIVPQVNLQNWKVPVRGNDSDSDDDIPLINHFKWKWSPDDTIPLINFKGKKVAFTSKDLPLISENHNLNILSESQVSKPSTVRSVPVVKRDGSSFMTPFKLRYAETLRKQKKNATHRKELSMLPEKEREIRRRWSNYLKRCERTKICSQFKNANEYEEAINKYKKEMEEGADDEGLIDLTDAAVATVYRNEDRIRQRLLNRELIPTHFLAYCNQENVDETDGAYDQFELSPMDQVCRHCDALYFPEERNTRGFYTGCCKNGTYHNDLPAQQSNNYPHLLRVLLNGTSMLSTHFMHQIMEYNNVFSFGSLGASDFRHTDRSGRLGVAVVVDGMIYHNAEYFLTNSTGQELPPAQLYYIGNAAAANARNNMSEAPLNTSLLKQIEIFLRANNPYAGAYRMLTEVLREVRNRPNAPPTNINLQIFEVRHSEQVAIRRNHGGDFAFPTGNEVAAVFTDLPPPGTKNLVIFPSNLPVEGGIPIGSTDPNRDSYLYPLLFPFGEQSWSYRLHRDVVHQGENPRFRVTARDFYSFLLKSRRDMFSPLLNSGKLTQQFVIDAWSRVQENQMEYQKSNEGQTKIRAETYGALKDYIENSNIFKPDMPGRVIPMPVDFVGSRKYIREKYLDAMAVCSKYKRPTYFLTLTCNPFSKAIMNHIPKGGNPIDYPEITSRVFQLTVDEMVHDLKKKHILGVCQALIYVIEWQKRSNHHCHFIVFIQEEDRPVNAVDVDNVISAEIPCPIQQPRLHSAVTRLMCHNKCGEGSNAKCMVPRKSGTGYECSKTFPKKFSHQSVLTEGKPATYRRRHNGRTFTTANGDVLDNRWIVPYNPYLLLKYNCHLNIELVSTVDILKYLFKYFFKGFDMSKIMLEVIDGEQVYDEFKHYIDCRHLSAMEAYWRLDSFPIHYNDHTVYRLPVHLENYQRVIVDDRNIANSLARSGSELIAYFKLNEVDANARRHLYTEIPYHYTYNTVTQSWKIRERTNKPLVTRLYGVNYNNLELYALRLLIMSVKGARSYEEIRNVRGTQYDSFHAASIALGLLTNDEMQQITFDEMVFVEMPHRLRCLFANLLIFITPSDPLALWNIYKSKMCEDYVKRKYSVGMAEQLALRHISSLLALAGFSNTDMKLPEPQFENDTEQRQADVIAGEYLRNRYDRVEEEAIGRDMLARLNDEQKNFFNRFMHCINTGNEQKLFFLDGPGGSGKTFLNRALISTLRGMGKVCTVTVWTGMGASLYKGGRTVHSTFRLPFDIVGEVSCNISMTSNIAAELRQTDILVWDEISMVNKNAFNAVDQLFRELKEIRNQPFGGIFVAASGDFRQTLPILTGATRNEIINNLVKKSNSWAGFEKHALRTNMRLGNSADVEFAALLVNIGDGKVRDYPANNYYDSYVRIPPECVSPMSLVDSIYGKTFKSSDIRRYCHHVILSTVHEDVDMLNELIYNRMTEDVCTEKTYYSTDSISNANPNEEELYDSTVLNNLNPKGTAPHKLTLRENCIIMLLRNLNPYDGFSNGTRLLVRKLYNNCIVGEIISGENEGKVILIPRIRMTAKVQSISEELLRIQFPVKLCFAMTIDKSQSQSFDSVGIYFRKPPFSHGQLYVALSRTRSKANLKVQIMSDSLMGKLDADRPDIYVPNIVYREAL